MTDIDSPSVGSAADATWLCFARRPAARAHLVCIPYAGGGAGVFREWHLPLGDDIELLACELPGRGRRMRESPITDVVVTARELAAALHDHLDGPFAILGHSMGALIGYELARDLAARGRPPLHFFPCGAAAPDAPAYITRVSALDDDQLLEAVRPLGGLPEPVVADATAREIFMPILRADLTAVERYVEEPGALLSCPVTALLGERDPLTPPARVAGWAFRTSASFRIERFPGRHFFLDDQIEAVASTVHARLAPS